MSAFAVAPGCDDGAPLALPRCGSNRADRAEQSAAGGAFECASAGQFGADAGAAGKLEGGARSAGGAGGGSASGPGGEGGEGSQAGNAGDSGRSTPVLVVSAGAASGPNSLYALELGSSEPSVQLLTHAIPPNTHVVSFSVAPNGARVAFVVAAVVTAVDVYVVDIDGSHTRKLSPDGLADGMAYILGWSPSGASLVFQHDGHNYAARADGSALFEVPSRDVTWTPDETHLVYADNRSVVLANLDGSDARTLAASTAPIAIEGWSSGGGWLMTASRPASGPAIQAWTNDGSVVRDLPSEHPTQPPLWSPTTEGLYAWVDANGDAMVSSVDADLASAAGASGVDNLSWSPDGSHLALIGAELVVTSVPISPKVSAIHVLGKSSAGLAPSFQWSPDGHRIAFAATLPGSANEDVLVQTIDGIEPSVAERVSGTAARGSSVRSFSWSPNARFVAYQADHRQLGTDELAITELASGRHLTLGKTAGHGLPRDGGSWSHDGRLLAFQLDSELTVLDTETFDSQKLEARLPSGTRSQVFQFGVRSTR
jgi:Tol biopolymer transport system component